MSPSRSVLAAPVAGLTPRIGKRGSSSTELNWPPTRTCRFSRAGIQHAGALDRVLRTELGDDLVHVQPELGQALLRDLDEDLLGLHAEELDLGHVGHAQQPLAHRLGVDAQFLAA